MLKKSLEIPDCFYKDKPTLVCPKDPTPTKKLYLSNLDDQKFLRFTIKYLYLYKRSISAGTLKESLSRVLVDYYPLAGRLRNSEEDVEKLELDCNGEGAVFAEAFMDFTAEEFMKVSKWPNRSWRKLLYRVETQSFLGVPPLVVQVTELRCGGTIICTAFNHCLCDGIGTSQFLHAWAHQTSNPTNPTDNHLLPPPFHSRHPLAPRVPPQNSYPHPEYTRPATPHDLTRAILSQSLVPTSLTFTSPDLLLLKRACAPSLKCTSFEALASHVWRAWAKSLGLAPSLHVKLLFSVNARARLAPVLPDGYYGNAFVLACAQATVRELVARNVGEAVRLVKEAKERVDDEWVRSSVDLLEVERRRGPDMSASLVISTWSKLGLEEVDFGVGGPMHMGPLASEIYCLFLPVVGDLNAFTVLMSVPEGVVERFEYYMRDLGCEDGYNDGGVVNGCSI
ncbi:Rosmarinate synthase [Acorus calamus]|uniref:Rosmarinate synthase n=1 Tax=Acorus calamus TaxID=4465 RepID=A0AAV9FAD7_ACOCL|nr:Rosmarinate synthase [Acorus calamus]